MTDGSWSRAGSKARIFPDTGSFPAASASPANRTNRVWRASSLEELNVAAEVGEEILVTEHAYPARTVRLHFRWCRIQGDPTAVLGQEMRWVTRDEMRDLRFPEADRDLIDLLLKPTSPNARSTVTVSPSLTVTFTGASS